MHSPQQKLNTSAMSNCSDNSPGSKFVDYVSKMNLAMQKKNLPLATYTCRDAATSTIYQPRFTASCLVPGQVSTSADSANKKNAKQMAAKLMLERLNLISNIY